VTGKTVMEVKVKLGKLPRLGKPPFLMPHHVQQDDLLEIVGEPYVVDAEKSKYGRERGYVVVQLVRTGEMFSYGCNTTSWNRLLDAFGDNGALWLGKKVKIQLENQTIRGEAKTVLFAVPQIQQVIDVA